MNRKQAKEMVGKIVDVWTSMHGTHTGILERLITEPGKPWRGEVSILTPGIFKEYKAGTIITAGGIHITENHQVWVRYQIQAKYNGQWEVLAWPPDDFTSFEQAKAKFAERKSDMASLSRELRLVQIITEVIPTSFQGEAWNYVKKS